MKHNVKTYKIGNHYTSTYMQLLFDISAVKYLH